MINDEYSNKSKSSKDRNNKKSRRKVIGYLQMIEDKQGKDCWIGEIKIRPHHASILTHYRKQDVMVIYLLLQGVRPTPHPFGKMYGVKSAKGNRYWRGHIFLDRQKYVFVGLHDGPWNMSLVLDERVAQGTRETRKKRHKR